MNAGVAAASALVVALAATPVAIAVARRTGTVDRPGELKTQTAAVPYLGGVAVGCGVLVGVLAGRPSVALPLLGALVLGVADDRADLPPLVRLAGELAVGIGVAATVPVHLPGAVGVPLEVAVTVLLVNGVNLLDGVDLLAAGTVAVTATGFALLLHGSARAAAAALAGALLGFAAYNRPPARIYLGDGGSYLLGTALAALLASAWSPGRPAAVGVAALALVALPAGEVAFAVVRRVRGRTSVLVGDRGHPYDRLVARGWPRSATSAAYAGCAAVLAAGAVVAGRRTSPAPAVAVDVAAAVLLTVLAGLAGALTPDEEVPR